jgi:hypothetical protein
VCDSGSESGAGEEGRSVDLKGTDSGYVARPCILWQIMVHATADVHLMAISLRNFSHRFLDSKGPKVKWAMAIKPFPFFAGVNEI